MVLDFKCTPVSPISFDYFIFQDVMCALSLVSFSLRIYFLNYIPIPSSEAV
jgi:hypothetical protein